MTYLQAIILGVVEGLTEFLPISSTGHLIIASKLLGLPSSDFVKTFEVFIQLGAILAVVVLYRRSLFTDIRMIKKVLVAFIPTAILGLLLYKFIKGYLMENHLVVFWSFLIGGIALIVFERWHKESPDALSDITRIPYLQAAAIGLFQSLAMIPGVSRSAATIVGGLLLGLKRTTVVEFSFLLALPTILAASVMDIFKHGASFNSHEFSLLATGFVTAFLVAIVAIKSFLKFIQNNSFVVFGVYRIIAAFLFLMII